MAGLGGIKTIVLNWSMRNPMIVYSVGGLSLLALRKYQTINAYNLWFGKQHFDRRVAKGILV